MKENKPGAGRKKGKVKIWVLGGLLLVLVLALILLLPIRQVTFVGNSAVSSEAIDGALFTSVWDKSLLLRVLTEKAGLQKETLYLSSYNLQVTGWDSVQVTVTEKPVIGYVSYMDAEVFFNEAGVVVEPAQTDRENVPRIEGLQFNYVVLYARLPVENETLFTVILNATQMLRELEIPADVINFTEEEELWIQVDDIVVHLGSSDYLEEKLLELSAMLPALEGRKGDLYLDTYDPDNASAGFIFKVEETSAQDEETHQEEGVQEEGIQEESTASTGETEPEAEMAQETTAPVEEVTSSAVEEQAPETQITAEAGAQEETEEVPVQGETSSATQVTEEGGETLPLQEEAQPEEGEQTAAATDPEPGT